MNASSPDVFVSYCSADEAITKTIVDFLSSVGVSAVYDRQFIKEGQWRLKLEGAIDGALLFVVVVSSATGRSVEVENEFRRARDAGKLVIPVLIEPCAPPLYLAALHRIAMYPDWDAALVKLLEAIREPFRQQRESEMAYLDRLCARLSAIDRYASMSGTRDASESGHEHSRFDDLVYRVVAERGDLLADSSNVVAGSVLEMITSVVVDRHGQIALLGDPGAGKTTTLRQTCLEMALAARNDSSIPLPVIASLRDYNGRSPLIQHIRTAAADDLRELSDQFYDLASRNRFAYLLDGLNEIPGADPEAAGIRELKAFITRQRDAIVVVTCRSVDYRPEVNLGIDTVRIEPLNPIQIEEFIRAQLKSETVEYRDSLFWGLVRDELAQDVYRRFLADGGTREEFWLSNECPERLGASWGQGNWKQWKLTRDSNTALLRLARNPYMLSMITRIYRALKGRLPRNRWQLFSLFVEVLVRDEEQRTTDPSKWMPLRQQVDALVNLAYYMRINSINSVSPDTAERTLGSLTALSFAISEKILEMGQGLSFTHQLLQEYFASHRLDAERVRGVRADAFWPSDQWWQPSGWDETTIFVVGAHPEDPMGVLNWIRDHNPELTARCAVESGVQVPDEYLQTLSAAWLPRLTSTSEPVQSRSAIGRALGRLAKDIRPGVSLVDNNGLPVIEWCKVPAGMYIAGGGRSKREVEIQYDYWVSRYLLTNAQYETFVADRGYSDSWRQCWTDAGWQAKRDVSRPEEYTEVFRLSNHPRIGVSWYEAAAFCSWLTTRLHDTGQLPAGLVARLPTDCEWEKAARGPTGLLYPWGDEFDYDKCNVKDVRSTTAVGIYPEGRSPFGVLDMIGNAWSWCLTKWTDEPQYGVYGNELSGSDPRCYRGGSWAYDFNTSKWRPGDLTCHSRYWIVPEDDRPDAIGFFVVVGPDVTAGADETVAWTTHSVGVG